MSLSDALSVASDPPVLDDSCLLEASESVSESVMDGQEGQRDNAESLPLVVGPSPVIGSSAITGPFAATEPSTATEPGIEQPRQPECLSTGPAQPESAAQPVAIDPAYPKLREGGGRSVPKKNRPVQLSQADMGIIYFSGGEHTLQSVERAGSTRWTEEEEAAYLLRVNEKARTMAAATAAQIVAQARDEAASIAEQARQSGHEAGYGNGYATGLATAESELEEVRFTLTESVSAMLAAIEDQRAGILARHADDLVEVTRLAVAKMAGIVLTEERRQIIASLLEGALAVLEDSREVTVSVNEEDEGVLREVMALVHERQPESTGWKIKADASITPGGIRVESVSSLAASMVESRCAAVEQALLHLGLQDGGV